MSEICPNCSLPKELCMCETIAREEQQITVSLVKRRFGKLITMIEGLDEKRIDLKELAKKLKTKLACGGTAKEGKIELQGDQTKKVKELLKSFGYAESSITVK